MHIYITIRDITKEECPWLEETIPAGTDVYLYHGDTYGCISPSGRAFTLVPDEIPFFELPEDSIAFDLMGSD